MIPLKLQLKNFLSYGSDLQEVDFTQHHLIYLSGRNGHGKSALLDAMTWAVWGQARKVTNAVRADQGLIRLGQMQMVVIFDFELNGQRYRIKREFLKTHNKPLVQLEFGLMQEGGNYIPLTDKTIRTTQAKIEKTIKLDYDSFVNTAFLRQGNANEFSKKSPKDRKEILATILGLQEFDQLKKRALEKIKQLQIQRMALSTLHESFAKQLEEKEAVEKEWEQIQKDRDDYLVKDKLFVAQKEALDTRGREIIFLQKKQDIAQFKLQEHLQKMEKEKQLLRSDVARWRTVHKEQHAMPDMAELEKEYVEHKKRLVAFDEKFKQHMQLEQEKFKLKQEMVQRKQEFEKRHFAAKQELDLKKDRLLIEQESLKKQILADEKEKQELQKKSLDKRCDVQDLSKQILSTEKANQMHKQFEKRKEGYHQFVAQRNMLQSVQQSLAQRQEMVQDDDPSCPLCEQNLSAARKKFLKNKCSKEERFARHQYERFSLLIPKLKELLINQHSYLDEQRKLQDKKSDFEKELKNILQKSKEVEQQQSVQQKRLAELAQLLNEVEKGKKAAIEKSMITLEKDEQYAKAIKAFNESEKAATTLSYKEEEHSASRTIFENIEKQRTSLFSLQQEVIKQIERKEQIAYRIKELKLLKKDLIQKEKEVASFDTIKDKIETQTAQAKEFEIAYKKYGEDREALREKWGVLFQKRKHFEKIMQESKIHLQDIKKFDLEVSDYQDIAVAAGKDGIQALLIEDAIPEVEQEANQLLSRLTNNQAQILIESLRDLKSGGSKETLDINISDPSGIRPYELFSGGEAFRIDFALRIAISKLLARRAGTALQTLIIDEGFGSQDEEGLSLIMDALYTIQDDFEKIIVVSHLPAMKDQFPVHFNVEKGPSGSQISVIEQG